jgi:hypothetical protein
MYLRRLFTASNVQLSSDFSSFSHVCGVVSDSQDAHLLFLLRFDHLIKDLRRFELLCCGKCLAAVFALSFRSLSISALPNSPARRSSRATISCPSEAESEISLAPRLDALALGRLDAPALWLF